MIHLVLSSLLFLTSLAFVIVTVGLFYHWRRYGGRSLFLPLMEIAYVIGGIILLAVAVGSYLQLN